MIVIRLDSNLGNSWQKATATGDVFRYLGGRGGGEIFRSRPDRPSVPAAYTGVLFGREGFQQIQLRTEYRENGDLGGGSPLVRGSGGSCNLVQEISFHIVKFS